ncbi:hypothetical protein, partial [Roseovarius sp.]|uniref:hypothetical protein n=1 Tax=Roseovarius sp. TaxID=1486281 RepID=UPI00262016A8
MLRLHSALRLLAVASIIPATAHAQTVLSGDHSVDGALCVGEGCTGSEDFGDFALKIKQNNTWLKFEDNSSTSSFPTNDWQIRVNDSLSGGADHFSIVDDETGNTIFRLDAGAPGASLHVASSGHVGLGTVIPTDELHIFDAIDPGITFEDPSWRWTLAGNDGGFYLFDPQNSAIPFEIRSGAPTRALYINSEGQVGLGTDAPAAPLEISDADSFSFFRITATGAPVNQSVDVVFTQGPLNTGELRYNIVDGDGPEMRLNADGDLVIRGTLTTGGPTCDGGCDAVFTERRIIPEDDYAARMWADGHLPFVGPTAPEAPINVSEKMGGMLNALEHAHVFIERQ